MPKRENVTLNQLRNLIQYKGLTDEEILEKHRLSNPSEQARIEELKEALGIDYDLSNLNANDKKDLDNLCTLYIRVQDLDELYSRKIKEDSLDWFEIEKLQKIRSSMEASISTIQANLNITRKARKGDKEASVVDYIEDLRKRAKQELKKRLSYIYCPKCKMLLATSWFLYPKSGNSITFTCGREECKYKFTITSSELEEKKNKNLEEMLET